MGTSPGDSGQAGPDCRCRSRCLPVFLAHDHPAPEWHVATLGWDCHGAPFPSPRDSPPVVVHHGRPSLTSERKGLPIQLDLKCDGDGLAQRLGSMAGLFGVFDEETYSLGWGSAAHGEGVGDLLEGTV